MKGLLHPPQSRTRCEAHEAPAWLDRAKRDREAPARSMWSVRLSGAFKPYDAECSAAIEEAYQRGDEEAAVRVAGQRYIIDFAKMTQCPASDRTRRRPVRRTAPPAPPPADAKRKRDEVEGGEATEEDEPPAPAPVASVSAPAPAPATQDVPIAETRALPAGETAAAAASSQPAAPATTHEGEKKSAEPALNFTIRRAVTIRIPDVALDGWNLRLHLSNGANFPVWLPRNARPGQRARVVLSIPATRNEDNLIFPRCVKMTHRGMAIPGFMPQLLTALPSRAATFPSTLQAPCASAAASQLASSGQAGPSAPQPPEASLP